MSFSNVRSKLVDGKLVFYSLLTGNEIVTFDPNAERMTVGGISIGPDTIVVDDAIDGLVALRVARATYNPTANVGERTIAPHVEGSFIPDKSIIVGGFVEVNALFDSADHSGSLAVSIEGANDIISAAAINGAPWSTTGRKAIIPKANTPETTSIKLTAQRKITFTPSVTALTVGKATAFLYYLVGA